MNDTTATRQLLLQVVVALTLTLGGLVAGAATAGAQNAVAAINPQPGTLVEPAQHVSAGGVGSETLLFDDRASGCCVAPSSARLAQDVAVSPSAPRALPLNRPVGASPSQNQFVQSRIAGLQEQGATAFRVNQQQVNINGVRVGINRPDLQYTLNGRRFYEEFDTVLSNRGPGHAARISANDPFGFINLFTVN